MRKGRPGGASTTSPGKPPWPPRDEEEYLEDYLKPSTAHRPNREVPERRVLGDMRGARTDSRPHRLVLCHGLSFGLPLLVGAASSRRIRAQDAPAMASELPPSFRRR